MLDEYDYTFEFGKAKVLRGGADVVFVSSGLMTMRALLAADELAKHRVDAAVVHTPTLKPFDAETVLRRSGFGSVGGTLENHTVVGGLFETVASAAVRRGVHRNITPVGAARRVPRRRCAADAARPVRPVDAAHRRIGARTAVRLMLTSKC